MNLLKLFKRDKEDGAKAAASKHYLTGREARAIARANATEMRRLERAKRRKVPAAEYTTEMKDGGNILEQNEPHAFFANPKEPRTIEFLSKVL